MCLADVILLPYLYLHCSIQLHGMVLKQRNVLTFILHKYIKVWYQTGWCKNWFHSGSNRFESQPSYVVSWEVICFPEPVEKDGGYFSETQSHPTKLLHVISNTSFHPIRPNILSAAELNSPRNQWTTKRKLDTPNSRPE